MARDELAALRDRVEELTEENRQLKEALAATDEHDGLALLGVRGQPAVILGNLVKASPNVVFNQRLRHALQQSPFARGGDEAGQEEGARVHVYRLRKRFAGTGVVFTTHWGEGWSMPRASVESLREMIAKEQAEGS